MILRTVSGWLAVLLTGVGLAVTWSGCTGTFVLNQTAERTGNITIQIINDTPYRASCSFGGWNALDRGDDAGVGLAQIRLAALTVTQTAELDCNRDFAIGTQEYYDRVVETKVFEGATFDPESFATVVHFSDAPADSDLAAAPTVGTALGVHWRLGVDYACGDLLLITFVEDPDAEGGFRIDLTVIPADTEDE